MCATLNQSLYFAHGDFQTQGNNALKTFDKFRKKSSCVPFLFRMGFDSIYVNVEENLALLIKL